MDIAAADVNATSNTIVINNLDAGSSPIVQIRSFDAAGNASATLGEQKITYDAIAPVTGILGLTGLDDTGTSGNDRITQDKAFTLSLPQQEPGATVAYQQKLGSGAWTNLSGASLSNLSDGVYQFRAQVTDAAGNQALSNEVVVTVDTTAPALPVLALANDTGRSSADGLTRDASLSLSSVAVGITRSFSVDDGAASPSYSAPTASGTYTVTVTDTDLAGNTSSATLTFTLDTAAPIKPQITLIADNSGSPNDRITNDRTPVFTVTAEAGVTLKVGQNGVETATAYSVQESAAGQYTITFTGELADGGYGIVAIDAVGNPSSLPTASDNASFLIDATKPQTPTITALADNSGNTSDRITNDATPQLTVVAEPGATEPGASLVVGQNGVATNKPYTVTESTTSPGTYTIAFTQALSDGTYGVRVTDKAGNVSDLLNGIQPYKFEIDTSTAAPVVSTVVGKGVLNIATFNALTDSSVILGGTAEPNAKVQITEQGSNDAIVVQADAQGAWVLTYKAVIDKFKTADAAFGTNRVSTAIVVATDVADNVSSPIQGSLTVDREAPVVTTASESTTAAVTKDAVTFTVTFSEALVGTVATSNFTATNGTITSVARVGDTNVYNVVVTPNSGVASGSVALSVVGGSLKDAAGNALANANLAGLASQAIDTLAPNITSAATATVAENTGAAVYTAQANEAVTYSLSGSDAGLFNINAGVVTFKVAPNFEQPADAGANNVYDFTVVATDAAGNASQKAVALTVDNVNEAPTVAKPIANAVFVVGGAVDTLTVPTDAFADLDAGTTLTYSATMADGSALPAWLTFTPGTRTFSGNPTTDGSLTLRVTASDGALSVSDEFVLQSVSAPAVQGFTVTDDTSVNGATLGKAGEALTFTVKLSESVTSTGALTATFRINGTDVTANCARVTTASDTLVFTGPTIAQGNNGSDITLTDISVSGVVGSSSGQTMVAPASPIAQSSSVPYMVDTSASAPVVSTVVGNGVLNIAGHDALTDSSVLVAGTAEANAKILIWDAADAPPSPQNALQVQANAQGQWALTYGVVRASLASGETVFGMNEVVNLNFMAVDVAGNSSSTTSGSLKVDRLPPSVASIAYGTNDGNLAVGEAVILLVTMSETVSVTGTPTIALANGGTATYVGGSASSNLTGEPAFSLTFSYTPAASHSSTSDLVTAANNALTGTILDLAGNAVTGSGFNAVNPLGILAVDSLAPVVTTVTESTAAAITKDAVTFTVTFSEALVGTVATSNFTATNGTITSVARVGDTNVYNVVVTPTPGVASGSVALSVVGGSLKDAAGNALANANLAGLASQAIDTLAPTITSIAYGTNDGNLAVGETVTLLVTMSEAVNVMGTPAIALANGGTANYAGGTGTSALTFSYMPAANDSNTSDLATAVNSALRGTIEDLAGNVALPTGFNAVNPQGILAVDTVAPAVSTVTEATTAAVTKDAVTFTVTFSEALTGAVGTDNFTATNGTVTSVAQVGDTKAYTVVVTPNSGVASGNVALSLVGGSLKDVAGNALADANLAGLGSQAIDTLAPVINSDATTSATENTGAAVYTAQATDLTAVTYSLNGSDAGLFNISTSTGAVTFKAAPNFEQPADLGANNVYDFTVVATDAAGNASQKAVALTVSNVNEAPTAVSLTSTLINNRIAESTITTSRVKVADLLITDDALGTNAVTLSDADAAAFEVENGVLYLKAGTLLNFETKTSFSVAVNVTDLGLTGSTPVTASYALSVTDVNEIPTGISLSASSIPSNTAAGAVVSTLSATDPDFGSLLSYSLAAGSGGNDADNALFTISGDQLLLAAGAALNPSTNPLIEINVKVTDAGGLSYTKAFVLNVTAAAITTAVTASQTYAATPNVRDIFEINAESAISPTISGFGAGDTLLIKNLSESTGIQFQNDPNNPPPILTIGNAQVGLETDGFFFDEVTFKEFFGSNAVIYA